MMNGLDIFDAMSYVSEETLSESEKKPIGRLKRYVIPIAVAAAAVIMLMYIPGVIKRGTHKGRPIIYAQQTNDALLAGSEATDAPDLEDPDQPEFIYGMQLDDSLIPFKNEGGSDKYIAVAIIARCDKQLINNFEYMGKTYSEWHRLEAEVEEKLRSGEYGDELENPYSAEVERLSEKCKKYYSLLENTWKVDGETLYELGERIKAEDGQLGEDELNRLVLIHTEETEKAANELLMDGKTYKQYEAEWRDAVAKRDEWQKENRFNDQYHKLKDEAAELNKKCNEAYSAAVNYYVKEWLEANGIDHAGSKDGLPLAYFTPNQLSEIKEPENMFVCLFHASAQIFDTQELA